MEKRRIIANSPIGKTRLDGDGSAIGAVRMNPDLSYSGVPMLLNTSFNLRGDPIVNSVEDAVKTYLCSGLDVLVIENFVLEKRPVVKNAGKKD